MESVEKTVEELKQRLEEAWTQEDGLKNKDVLQRCVEILEANANNIPIHLILSSKIGKTINDSRKTLPTEDVKLAKRMRKLVSGWKTQGVDEESNASQNGSLNSPTLNSPINGPVMNGHRPGNRLDQIKQEYGASPKLSSSSSPLLVNGRHQSSSPNFPPSPAPTLHSNGSPASRTPASPAIARVLTSSVSAPKIESLYHDSPSVAQGVKRRSLSRERSETTPLSKARAPAETETSSTPGSGLKLKIKLGGKAVVDRAVENPLKRQRIEERSESPFIGSDSGSGDAFDLSSTPSSTHPKPGREKVKTQKELLEAIRKQNPNLGPIGASSEASCDPSKKSVMYSSSRSSKPVEPEVPEPKPTHPPGRGPDPVAAELAEILAGLPPLHSDVHGDVTSPVMDDAMTSAEVNDSGSFDAEGRWHGWTEAYSDSTRSGQRMVILPYIYFPFPPT